MYFRARDTSGGDSMGMDNWRGVVYGKSCVVFCLDGPSERKETRYLPAHARSACLRRSWNVAKIVRGADSAAAAIWRSVISGLFKEARISPPSESVSRKVIDIWAAVISQHIGELAEGESINRLLAIVNAQAEDEGLWFVAHDAPTSYI